MEDFSSLESNVKAALVSTTRSASSLASQDIPFQRSIAPSVGTALDRQNARLLALAEGLVGVATANTEIVRPPRLHNLDAVDDSWKAVVDVVDSLLERADTALDEFTGAVKRLSPGVEAQGLGTKPTGRVSRAIRDRQIDKPQLLFDNVPTNHETQPFRPLLLSKPHALRPLDPEPRRSGDDSQAQYPHPYQLEIEQYRYPSSMYSQTEPVLYLPFDSTVARLVDTEQALDVMLEELKQAKEIAIDLEHHDSRSYIGIVSLMQISTRDQDWIVDTLRPWRRKLQCLNQVFADPNIVKVLHGAFMDVMWLQRDLGLYIVGLFDTHYAARALGYTGGSLAFLLKKFVNIDAQKQYQMADWRVRPLPQELVDYARSDTHYLLYIFDNMRNELIQKSDFSAPNHEKDKVWDVLEKSSEVALQRYEHPQYDEELGLGSMGWYKLLSRTPVMLTKEQFSVFRAVHKWRDEIAREQDDSVHFIMPNHNIFNLARATPPTRLALLSVVTPTTQTVRLRADELVAVVATAKEAGRHGPEMMELLERIEPHAPKKHISAASQLTSEAAPSAHVSTPALTGGFRASAELPIRSSTSLFWGAAFDNSVQRRTDWTTFDVQLAVPLPPLTAEIFADGPSDLMTVKESEPSPEPFSSMQESENDLFILKDMNKKRKHGVDRVDGMAANSDEVALPDEVAELESTRLQKRAAKRAARKAAKPTASGGNQESKNMSQETRNDDDEVPFDYASATSILNPPREKLSAKGRKKKQKQIDPYKKSLDAPKGLPRMQKETAGRSRTFKN